MVEQFERAKVSIAQVALVNDALVAIQNNDLIKDDACYVQALHKQCGHSIGQVRCGAFFERLYNFESQNTTDPSMDPAFADLLKAQCPQTSPFAFMALDTTNGTFDSSYYLDLLTNKGLLESDVALLTDPLGVEYAIKAVQDPDSFLFEFGVAMIKMGNIPSADPYGWRKHCAFTEPQAE